MPKNLYLRAEFKEARGNETAVGPTLEFVVTFHLGRSGGGGHTFNVPDDVNEVRLVDIVPYLFWRREGDTNWLTGLIGTGELAPASYLTALREGEGPIDCTVAFPLTSHTVSRIEDLRRGQKPRFRLILRVTGYWTFSIDVLVPTKDGKGIGGVGLVRKEQIAA